VSSFECRVVGAGGKREVFVREAAHEASVLRDLNQEGYFILSVKPAALDTDLHIRKLKPAVILEFTQILSTLMANGLGLKEALAIAGRISGKSVAPLLKHAEERVGKGDSLYDALFEAIDGLPEEQRAVLEAQVLDGFTFEELSEMSGISPNTLSARKRRALKWLALELGDWIDE